MTLVVRARVLGTRERALGCYSFKEREELLLLKPVAAALFARRRQLII
jgi:hypothetical protein